MTGSHERSPSTAQGPAEGPGPALVAARDAFLVPTGAGTLRIGTAARAVLLSVDDRAAADLRRLFTEILPRFQCPGVPADQLDTADLRLLQRYQQLIARLELLIEPGAPALGAMTTPAHAGLYGYLARRTDQPDDRFLTVRRRPVALVGPQQYLRTLIGPMEEQGLCVGTLTDWHPEDAPPALGGGGITLVVTMTSDDARTRHDACLRAVNRTFIAAGEPWVPVDLTPRRIRIGPWTAPGASACLGCLAGASALTRAGDPFGWCDQSPDAPSPGIGDGDGDEATRCGTPWITWSTALPGMVHWTAGLIAHLLLRTMVPSGPFHPWGTLVSLDAERIEQCTVRLWRDPGCPDCGEPAPRAHAWRQV